MPYSTMPPPEWVHHSAAARCPHILPIKQRPCHPERGSHQKGFAPKGVGTNIVESTADGNACGKRGTRIRSHPLSIYWRMDSLPLHHSDLRELDVAKRGGALVALPRRSGLKEVPVSSHCLIDEEAQRRSGPVSLGSVIAQARLPRATGESGVS